MSDWEEREGPGLSLWADWPVGVLAVFLTGGHCGLGLAGWLIEEDLEQSEEYHYVLMLTLTHLLCGILSLEVLMVWYPGQRLTDSEAPAGLCLVVGGLTGSAGEIWPGDKVVRHQRVPGVPVGDHPGAALPGQGEERVLVTGRLADL